MSIIKTIKREAEVAFSKKSQPVWLRILKYAVLGVILYFFWGTKTLWIIIIIVIPVSIGLHFWYRYKTKGWTKSYGLWKYHDSKSDQKEE